MNRTITFFISMLLFVSLESKAIVIRHDKTDIEYQKLAKKYSPSMAYLDKCAATVLSDNWVITAAHCVSQENNYPVSIEHLGQKYPVSKIVTHPDAKKLDDIDVALLQLRWPLTNSRPVSVYTESDELNKNVVFVGKGKTGNGQTGELSFDHISRAATNIVSSVEKNWILFNFDKGNNATDLEGVSGTEDSGGPAFVNTSDGLKIIGVGCCQQPGVGVGGSEVQGSYGSVEYYTRLSQIKEWIEENVNMNVLPVESRIANHIKNGDIVEALSLIEASKLSTFEKEELEEIVIAGFYYYPEILKSIFTIHPELSSMEIQSSPLIAYAFMNANRIAISNLIELEIGLNYKGFKGQQLPSLMAWQYFGGSYIEHAESLIKKGLDINQIDTRGDTALHMAVYSGIGERVEGLIRLGANIDAQNNKGNTPLMDAVRRNNVEIANLLISLGSSQKLVNKKGESALDIAKKNRTINSITF